MWNTLLLSILAFTSVFIIVGCSQPATTSVAVAGEQVQQSLVGYRETEYVYTIKVPNEHRWVQMVTEHPLPEKPTYDDYLQWKSH